MSELYKKLHDVATHRSNDLQPALDQMDKLAALYEGEIPQEYSVYFPKNSPRHVVNFIRLAWDDLAQTVARSPEVQVDPMDSTAGSLRRSQKLEKIVQGYFQNARPTQHQFLFQMSFNLVGLGRAVAVAVPDKESGAPRLEPRDPRLALPGAKRSINGVIEELSDIIFVYDMDRKEAYRQGFCEDDKGSSTVRVYEYIDDNMWAMASSTHTKSATHGLGMVPAVYMSTYSPNRGGIGQFDDQISLMVAVSRIISAKVAYLDRMVYPITFGKGIEEEVTLGPNTFVKLSQHGDIGQLTPPAQLQVDRDLANLERYQRILNRNPEVRQGEVDGKGAYVGAKTLEALNDSVDNSVARFWDVMQAGLEQLAAIALAMDEKLFDERDKTISVVRRGQRHVETYTPSEDIDGRRDVRVAYGFGVGGSYQAFLENVQGFQSELTPKRRAVEEMPGVQDANKVLRELELDKLDNIAFANFEAMATQGQIDMVLWASIRKQMEKKGLSLYEAIGKYEEKLKAQAEEAAEQPLPDSALTQAPPMPAPEADMQLAGLPPTAALGI